LRKRIYLLDLVLLALVAVLYTKVQNGWKAAQERQRAVIEFHQKVPAPQPDPPLVAPPPVTPAAYAEVALKMLFSRDRNPNVVIEVVAPKPMPALPGAQGVINLGGLPRILLSEKAGMAARSYRAGESVGPFKLLEVRSDVVVFEWEGKRITKKVEELMEVGARMAPPEPSPVATPSAAPTSVSTGSRLGPGVATSQTTRTCQTGDDSPAGTIVDGMKKVMTQTPFGFSCVWQAVQ
jgi:hypothetical protein